MLAQSVWPLFLVLEGRPNHKIVKSVLYLEFKTSTNSFDSAKLAFRELIPELLELKELIRKNFFSLKNRTGNKNGLFQMQETKNQNSYIFEKSSWKR